VSSFSLVRYPVRHAARAMAGMVTDRRALAATPGLRFARQLGTGRGVAMGLGGDLRRWAAFCVWDDEGALDGFLAGSPVADRWQQQGEEWWTVRLALVRAHGTWGGRDPFAGVDAAVAPGPVAVLTRATIPPRHWPAFYRAVPAVEAQLHGAEGVLAAVGIGELPVGLQATFSLWRSATDVDAFAYGPAAHGPSSHARVIARTRRAGWFREELFARFRPYASTGTWSGRDPLGGNGS